MLRPLSAVQPHCSPLGVATLKVQNVTDAQALVRSPKSDLMTRIFLRSEAREQVPFLPAAFHLESHSRWLLDEVVSRGMPN